MFNGSPQSSGLCATHPEVPIYSPVTESLPFGMTVAGQRGFCKPLALAMGSLTVLLLIVQLIDVVIHTVKACFPDMAVLVCPLGNFL